MPPCNSVLHKWRAIKAHRFCISLPPAEELICSVARNELHLLELHTCFLVHGNCQLSNQHRAGANSQGHTNFATLISTQAYFKWAALREMGMHCLWGHDSDEQENHYFKSQMRQFKSDMLNSKDLAWYQSISLKHTSIGTNQHGYVQQMFWRCLKRNKKMWQRKAYR